jgi:hypothetical protein
MSKFSATGDPRVDIPALIKWRGNGLTFVELLQHLPYLEGDCIYGDRDRNIAFWVGVSRQCIDALVELVNDETIRPASTLPLTYFIDGGVPNLPVAKSNRRYKKPHWAPITFSLAAKASAAPATNAQQAHRMG